jgi:2-succinyl-6-hydroxy-2,4-cyclohexadiene-1-carboxylate synthase
MATICQHRPVHLHAEQDGTGPRLVLVHGFTQTRRCWGALASDLSADHEVLRIDAPGHGRSSELRADLPAGADLLADAGGSGTYVGYSMGARLCLHVALQHPEVVRGLVLVGGTAGIDDPEEREARCRQDRATAARVRELGVERFVDEWLAQPIFSTLRPEDACRQARLESTVEGLASSLELAGTGSQAPLWDDLHRIEVPVLVVAGAQDAKFAALGRRVAAAVGGNAERVLVPDAGHTAHLEQPTAFLDALRPWLAHHGL